ncbi:hypothetical protein [Burkholderia thailandensis]|uniref:hypothetical protein n=1 Tax=Burkholderia thailandensis TaxID=57975 RepID=UPI0005BD3EDF|nr:hypothetical protein [Burkholderia thailandensis]PNE69284.1 hypothetical protein A8H38_25360 [Burkholderia thailandensis]
MLPLLEGPRLTHADARAALRAWFSDAPRAVQAACDSETDWFFLLDLLSSPRPTNLADQYYDLRSLIDTIIYDRTIAAYYETDAR